MELHLENEKRGNCFPHAYNILNQLDDVVLKYQEHGLKHPLGIYNTSSTSLFDIINRISIQYQEIINDREKINLNSEEVKQITSLISEMFHLMQSHYDDCYSIMKTFYSKAKVSKKIVFTDKWLESISCPGIRYFKNAIADNRSRVASYVNKIKHNQGRLLLDIWKNKDDLILGFYLFGEGDGEAIGAYTDINQGRPVSLNRELLLILYDIYHVGYHLSEAIKLILAQEASKTLNDSIPVVKTTSKEESIIYQISKMRKIVLPSEQSLSFPRIDCSGSDSNFELFLEFPSDQTAYTPLKMTVLSNAGIGDGITKQFKRKLF